MKKLMAPLLVRFLRIALWFRYKIKVEGVEKLTPDALSKPGGILFLPNHPTIFVDATSIPLVLWKKFNLRPLIVEYMYYTPIIHSVMKMLDALPIPNFSESTNSIKRKKNEIAIQAVIDGLRQRQNFLVFPAGRVKQSGYEALDGASAIHRILQEAPETNVVLVRVKGLWGSSFSRALTGQTPAMFATIFKNMKHVFKNLLFFTPRRQVIIEFEPAPSDFPYKAGRLVLNKYMEQWYNRPDGLTKQEGPAPGDSLVLVSYSMWKKEIPTPQQKGHGITDEQIKIDSIPADIKQKVILKLAELLNIEPSSIKPHMSLAADLGMDSLDLAEVIAFLQDQFDVSSISPNDLTSVIKVMALASKQVQGESVKEEDIKGLSKWRKPVTKKRRKIAPGETIPEVFLNNCSRMGKAIACADMRSGIVTYDQLKMRALILADYIKSLPGKHVGILLPASTAASMTILACQLAGKIPLMVNWTVGPRHLQAIVSLTDVKVVLSSWAFIDRLQNVDFDGIDDRMVMLEDVRRNISLKKKLYGFFLSKMRPKTILKHFNIYKKNPNDPAVLLFTSGTESLPKGVPLSHNNILSNQRASLEAIELFSDDIFFGILPPFHSFGFTITSLIGLLAGVKVAFSPDPTDGKRLASGLERWRVTILCGAPSFVKNLIKAARLEQLNSLRLCITGAEKLPSDLIMAMDQLGKGQTLYEGYGITECSPVLTFNPIGKPRKGVGQPLSNVEICIVDLVAHKPVPKGQQGLVLARGPNVFSGYINPGQASPFINVDGKDWYNTGDLGYQDEQNNLILSGRLKRFIKVGGEMISLAAIEEALIQACMQQKLASPDEGPLLAICGKEIPGDKPRIFLFTKFPISLDEANRQLREAGFSNLLKITSVVQLSEIPLMGTGKVHYRKLEEEYIKG